MTETPDLDAITQLAADVISSAGGELVDPAAILPADIPLELSGEAVRARLCIFTDVRGGERVMRPDLTLPVADAEATRRSKVNAGETTYRYAARAFRLPLTPYDPMEFTQIGVEKFGYTRSPQADADLFVLICHAAQSAGARIEKVSMGDLAVFPAFVDALSLADATAGLLKRAFRQVGGVRKLLLETPEHPDLSLADRLAGQTSEQAERILMQTLDARDIELIGTRSADEIITGLIAKAEAARIGGVPETARSILDAVLDVSGTPEAAVLALRDLAKGAGLTAVGPQLDALAARVEAIERDAPDLMKTAIFETPFGRRFNYYDGFVFEAFGLGADAAHPLASGGRYDALIGNLSGGKASATALGGVVRPDRIANAMRAGAS